MFGPGLWPVEEPEKIRQTLAATRACAIRGSHTYPVAPPAQPRRYGLADSLHLAAAIESGCDVFLTNDNQLANFADIAIEILP